MSKVQSIKNKIEKDHEAFYDSVYGLSISDLKKNILMYAKYLQDTNNALKSNAAIGEAEELLKEAKKLFMDKIKEARDKIKQLKSFVDKSICVDDLESQIVIYTIEAEEQKIKMSNSGAVQNAKSELDMIKEPFTEAKRVYELKISYLNILIAESQGFEAGYQDGEAPDSEM